MTDVDTVINPQLLTRVGTIIPGHRSALSPLHAYGGGDLDDMELEALKNSGVLDSARNLNPSLGNALAVIASCRRLAHARISAGAGFLDFTLYFGNEVEEQVSITSMQDGVRIQSPAAAPIFIDFLKELVGASALRVAEFSVEMNPISALTLGALLDEHRLQSLEAISNERNVEPVTIDIGALKHRLTNETDSPTSFVAVIKQAYDSHIDVSDGAITSGLTALSTGGLIERNNQSASLCGPALVVATRMLVFECVFTMLAARESATSTIETVGLTCVQAGAHDLLAIESAAESIRLECISPNRAIAYATLLITGDESIWSGISNGTEELIPAKPEWAPTHTVPASGLPAWPRPDSSGPASATLDPWLEVQVASREGDWALIVCSNQWTAWVDGRALEEVRRA
jgi:hypothetical protein